MSQINQYANAISVMANQDYLDVDMYVSPGVYQSSKILWSDFVNNVPNIFNSDGVLISDRDVDTDGFDIGFTGGGNMGIGIPGPSALAKLHVGGHVIMSTLQAGAGTFISATVPNEIAGRTRVADGMHIGSSTAVTYNGSSNRFAVEVDPGNTYLRVSSFGVNRVGIVVEDPADFTARELFINASGMVLNTSATFSIGTGSEPFPGYQAVLGGKIDHATTNNIKSAGDFSTWTRSMIVGINGVDHEIALKAV